MLFKPTRDLLKEYGGLIAAGFILVFFSVFGQSVLFGTCLPQIQEELGLSKTTLGTLYAIATISSSVLIIFTGKGLDRFRLRNFLAFVTLGVAVGCFLMSFVKTAFVLLLAFFILRHCGQGLMVLAATTSINRYVDKNKGKAVALIMLGGAFHLMLMPVLAIHLANYMNWRTMWLFYGLFMMLLFTPGMWFFLRAHQQKTHAKWEERVKAESEKAAEALTKEWTRKHVLGDYRFYGLMCLTIVPPFVGTILAFYQIAIAESLNIEPVLFASTFTFFASCGIAGTFIAGHIIDTYGEKPVLVAYPIVYSIGLLALTATGGNMLFVYVGMGMIGMGNGLMQTTGGPLLTHLYGTKHLGSIKSLLFSSSIISSALSPLICGFFMDQGVDILSQMSWVFYYTSFIWLLAFPICKGMKSEKAVV